jgi:LacI family transcriptional regulator
MGLKSKDIAEMLNISKATVSLAINNKTGVSAETKSRVMQIIQDNNLTVENMRNNSASAECSIRIIIYKKHGKVVMDTPFFAALFEGCDYEAKQNNANLLFSYVSEKDNISGLGSFSGQMLDGIIVLATEIVTSDEIKKFKKLNLPMVILDSNFNDVTEDIIMMNNYQGVYQGALHLYKMGHREIGYLQSAAMINNFREREEGFRRGLSDLGIPLKKEFLFILDSDIDGSYVKMKQILDKKPKLPTAVMAGNDLIATGALKALKEAGYTVPKDISIVGFDDMPICEVVEPTLTTISVPKHRIGMTAVRRLIDKINDENDSFPVKIELSTVLVSRNSVAKITDQQLGG